MADDVVRLLDSLKIPKAHILGVSMGGMIAQEIAINHPEKLKGLVLVCTSPGGSTFSSIPGQEEALRKLTWMFAPPPGMSPQTVLEKMCELCYYGNYFEENKARIMAFMPKYPTPLSTFEKHYDAITKLDIQDRLKTRFPSIHDVMLPSCFSHNAVQRGLCNPARHFVFNDIFKGK